MNTVRASNGRYLPGTSGNPGGRPGGRPSLWALAEAQAVVDQLLDVDPRSLEARVWVVLSRLLRDAEQGDNKAADLALRYLWPAGPVVEVDARQQLLMGPPSPPRRERAQQLLEVHKIIAEIEKDQTEKSTASLLDEAAPVRARLPAVEPEATSGPSAGPVPTPTPPPPAPRARPFCPVPPQPGTLAEAIANASPRRQHPDP